MAWDYDALHKAPHTYFDAVDAKDMEGALSFFAPDATFTIQSARLTFEGRDGIRSMFENFFVLTLAGVTGIIVSIGVTVVVSAVGVLFGLLSGSMSILFDGVFAAIDAAMSGLALFVSRLVSGDNSNRRFQFGYWHIEPMVLAFNGGTLMLLCAYAFVNAIASLLAGGRHLQFDWAIAYAVCFRHTGSSPTSTSWSASRSAA